MPRGSWLCPRCNRGVVECECDDHRHVRLPDGAEIVALNPNRWIIVGGKVGRSARQLAN